MSSRGQPDRRTMIFIMAVLTAVIFFAGLNRDGLFDRHEPATAAADRIGSKPDSPEHRKRLDKFYKFRSWQKLADHFQKHRGEFDYDSEKDYLYHANLIINDPRSRKSRQADGDEQYLNPDTCEYVVLSRDGYIRTYFRPGRCEYYFEKQK
ncbi:MAG: hypothetical protein IJ523_11825 [Succinivibrionaceae bacterium]|nr:hypothetical protein [Succinivibrionaceae bacterium]